MYHSSLGLLEKWIAEHGSAAVFKEHNGFLLTQLAAIDRQLAETERQRDQAKAELADRKEAFADAQIKLIDCERKREELNERYHGLKPIQVDILEALPEQDYIRLHDIASVLGISQRQALHHLATLNSKHLVTSPNYSSDPDWDTGTKVRDSAWRTTERGLSYLAANDRLD